MATKNSSTPNKQNTSLSYLRNIKKDIFNDPVFSTNTAPVKIAPVQQKAQPSLLEKAATTVPDLNKFADYLLNCDNVGCFLHRVGMYKISFYDKNPGSLGAQLLKILETKLKEKKGLSDIRNELKRIQGLPKRNAVLQTAVSPGLVVEKEEWEMVDYGGGGNCLFISITGAAKDHTVPGVYDTFLRLIYNMDSTADIKSLNGKSIQENAQQLRRFMVSAMEASVVSAGNKKTEKIWLSKKLCYEGKLEIINSSSSLERVDIFYKALRGKKYEKDELKKEIDTQFQINIGDEKLEKIKNNLDFLAKQAKASASAKTPAQANAKSNVLHSELVISTYWIARGSIMETNGAWGDLEDVCFLNKLFALSDLKLYINPIKNDTLEVGQKYTPSQIKPEAKVRDTVNENTLVLKKPGIYNWLNIVNQRNIHFTTLKNISNDEFGDVFDQYEFDKMVIKENIPNELLKKIVVDQITFEKNKDFVVEDNVGTRILHQKATDYESLGTIIESEKIFGLANLEQWLLDDNHDLVFFDLKNLVYHTGKSGTGKDTLFESLKQKQLLTQENSLAPIKYDGPLFKVTQLEAPIEETVVSTVDTKNRFEEGVKRLGPKEFFEYSSKKGIVGKPISEITVDDLLVKNESAETYRPTEILIINTKDPSHKFKKDDSGKEFSGILTSSEFLIEMINLLVDEDEDGAIPQIRSGTISEELKLNLAGGLGTMKGTEQIEKDNIVFFPNIKFDFDPKDERDLMIFTKIDDGNSFFYVGERNSLKELDADTTIKKFKILRAGNSGGARKFTYKKSRLGQARHRKYTRGHKKH